MKIAEYFTFDRAILILQVTLFVLYPSIPLHLPTSWPSSILMLLLVLKRQPSLLGVLALQ